MDSRFVAFLSLILILSRLPLAYAAGPYRSLGDLFQHQLAGLQLSPPGPNPYTGGRSPLHCCNLAINESLEIQDGNLIFRPGQTCLKGDPNTFLQYQYPCTATYNGSRGDQPQVWVSYSWCRNNCPGWTRTLSTPKAIRNWVQPFISFIMPAIIFCLNVARRRRITVPSRLFPQNLFSFSILVTLIVKIPIASILVTLDILFWLITILSVAGPCLVSGIYEAVLDFRLINFVEGRVIKNGLTIQQRAHLLFVILLGNFDQDPTWNDMLQAVDRLPGDSVRQRLRSTDSTMSKDTVRPALRSMSSNEDPTSLKGSFTWSAIKLKNASQSVVQMPYEITTQVLVGITKTKLKTLLEAQMGFGAAVGAAVVFYTSSFIFSLMDLYSSLGSSNTSHNLAFGMFWMIVPHVAVVSSLLLSGSNPNTWEAICCSTDREPATKFETTSPDASSDNEKSNPPGLQVRARRWMPKHLKRIRGLVFRPVYKSTYKLAWPWHWGSSKAIYVARLIERYPNLKALEEEVLRMSLLEWVFSVTLPALFLLLVPSFLGGMVSYTTPSVGLSCRSMTMLLYAVAQTLLILLWMCDWIFWRRDSQGHIRIDLRSENQRPFAGIIWYFAFFVGVGISFFTAIFGSIFQLLGLYANCLCFLPIQYWRVRNTSPDAVLYLGSASVQQIYYASTYWIPTGVAATAFLIATTYIGWWYQRHLRHRFTILADNIDCVNSKDLLENEGQEQGGLILMVKPVSPFASP